MRAFLGGLLPDATAPTLLVAASPLLAAAVLCGCAPGDDVMTTTPVPHGTGHAAPPGPTDPDGPELAVAGQPASSNLTVSPEQRAYLDQLAAAGVHPSSELMALSIGSYVCQAHAAGQSDQAVRDFVLPLVRGDVHDAHPDAPATSMTSEVDDDTAAYMRIATERLC